MNKYNDQEALIDEVVNAHEKLMQQNVRVKETEQEKDKAVEGLINTNPCFGCVAGKRHKQNNRQRERSKQKNYNYNNNHNR